MRWLRTRPEFADLSDDAPGVRSLASLVIDMDDAGASPMAWGMLCKAVAVYASDDLPAPSKSALIDWARSGEV